MPLTIIGFNHKSGVLTLVDRSNRFLIAAKLARLGSKEVKLSIIKALSGQPLQSITPDRGREFQLHGDVTKAMGVEFYFPPPHQPWQCSTNGLLREYFPKGYDFTNLTDENLQKSLTRLIKDRENVWGILFNYVALSLYIQAVEESAND